MAKRDALTILQTEDGFIAKLHGYPFEFDGNSRAEALGKAGWFLDECELAEIAIKTGATQKAPTDTAGA
jgi:hypothetical protein